MTEVISIPANLTPLELFPFSVRLKSTTASERYVLDFQRIGHVEPFGMLFLGAIIRQFIRTRRQEQGKECKIEAINYREHSYASFMGLFQSFGLNFGHAPGQAVGSGTYIPLTRLPISRLLRDARNTFTRQGDIIELEAEKAAKVLTRNDEGPITETLSYAIRELMRNIVEHGDTTHIWYAAQYWPSRNRVEFAILDEGVGLLPSLRRNPKLKVDTVEQAIHLALQPGISGVANPNRRIDGDWVNTGYGLYMISSLGRSAGNFVLCNYTHAIDLENDLKNEHPCAYKGLAIRLVLNTEKINDLNELLGQFRKAAKVP